ncbi:MAG: hypothetical protein JNM99_22885 [Verrucomicrobiaceae bacterium]|nr:hypothetical protein [Verrucomicrobiaceae bacterium]
MRAVEGEELAPEQLHAAIAHLWKRRGYEPVVPWSTADVASKGKDEWKNTLSPTQTADAFAASGCEYPCQFLRSMIGSDGALEGERAMKQRNRVWTRGQLEREFRAIVAAQPSLQRTITVTYQDGKTGDTPFLEWLLYGDGHLLKKGDQTFRIYNRPVEGRNPGVLGLKYPRFKNRKPGLDLLRPYDELGRPQHVVQNNRAIVRQALWNLAIENFRVIDVATGSKVKPDSASLDRLQAIWMASVPREKVRQWQSGEGDFRVEISAKDGKKKKSVLTQWAEEHRARYTLIEGQQELHASSGGEGRAKFSTPTLEAMVNDGEIDLQQTHHPLLVRPGQSMEDALNAYLTAVRSPLVRHRLTLFRRQLDKLVEKHGQPDLIIVESLRSFAMGRKRKDDHLKEIKKNAAERDSALKDAKKEGLGSSRTALTRYRLWKEARGRCPFCGEAITQEQFRNHHADIAHLVPQAVRKSDEFFNLTIAHTQCNRVDMQAQIARVAFANRWEAVEKFARDHFKDRKLQLFLAHTMDEALDILGSRDELVQSAYIARLIRRLCIIRFGWQGMDGRDPSDEKGNLPSQQFLVSNGSLTSAFRDAWGLNTLLHGRGRDYTREQWHQMSKEQQEQIKAENYQRKQKNRGDHRHHAIDAMVITCTLPWLARRIVDRGETEEGKLVWWTLDPAEQRARAWNPLFPGPNAFRTVVERWLPRIDVHHHMRQDTHRQPAKTTFYSRRGVDRYIVREDIGSLTPADLGTGPSRQCRVHPPEQGAYLWELWKGYVITLRDYVQAVAFQVASSQSFNGYSAKDALKAVTDRLCYDAFEAWRSGADRSASPALPETPTHPMKLEAGTIKVKLATTAGAKPEYSIAEAGDLFKTLPADFTRRLCFAAFQRWREKGQSGEPKFPSRIRIPIRKVRYVAKLSDEQAVIGPRSMPGKHGGHVYVARTDFREVRLMRSADGTGYVPVFVPIGKGYNPFSPYGEYRQNERAAMVIRKRQKITLVHDYNEKCIAGDYVVEVMGTGQVTLSLPHVVRNKTARPAFGMPASGFQPYWDKLIPALGLAWPTNVKADVLEADAETVGSDEDDQS